MVSGTKTGTETVTKTKRGTAIACDASSCYAAAYAAMDYLVNLME